MATYVPLIPVPLQFVDTNGDPLESGTLEFYLSGTSTPANLFSDSSGTSIGTSITLNSSGYPESGGNVITLFRDTSINYKIIGKNSAGVTQWTSDTLNSVLAVLAKTSNGDGASLIGIEDSAGNFTATDVEGALAEVFSDLASTSNALGASLVGVEDSLGKLTATNVEDALAEIAAVTKFKTADTSRSSTITRADDDHLAGWSLEAASWYTIEGFIQAFSGSATPNFSMVFQLSETPQDGHWGYHSVDEAGSLTADHQGSLVGSFFNINLDANFDTGIWIKGVVQTHASNTTTLDFQWAQEVSDATATALHAGSWIRVAKIS